MRHILAGLLATAAFASPAAAIGDLASFERIHTECVSVGGVSFGPQGRWADCRVDKGRWFSTIGHIDFYQTQYCLGSGGQGCAQRALLLFANRAYTPVAKMVLGRLDPGDVAYTDPIVVLTEAGMILTLEIQPAGGPPERRYYLWSDPDWRAIDSTSWRKDLARRLPPGVVVQGDAFPDLDNMRVQASLLRKRDKAPGSADIELALVNARLTVKSVQLALPPGK